MMVAVRAMTNPMLPDAVLIGCKAIPTTQAQRCSNDAIAARLPSADPNRDTKRGERLFLGCLAARHRLKNRYIDSMVPNQTPETGPQHEFDDFQQDGGISVLDIVRFLQTRFVQLFVIALLTGAIALGVGYFIHISEGSRVVGAYEFEFAFDGASDGHYPNGIPFSPQDVLAAPVLDAVYTSMNLAGKFEKAAFRTAFTIVQGGIELRLLQIAFEQKLSNTKLTAAERTTLEHEYQAARATLEGGTFILTGDFSKSNLTNLECERILAAIPVAWAEFAQKTRGVGEYDMAVPTLIPSAKLPNGIDRFFLAEGLLSTSRRTSECLRRMEGLPGASLVVDRLGRGIADLAADVETSTFVELVPMYCAHMRLAFAQDPEPVNLAIIFRLENSKRAVEMAEAEADLATKAFQDYVSLGNGGNVNSQGPGSTVTGSGMNMGGMPMINLSGDFFDRIISQGLAAKDIGYRQLLNDEQLKRQATALALKNELARDEWMLKQILPYEFESGAHVGLNRIAIVNDGSVEGELGEQTSFTQPGAISSDAAAVSGQLGSNGVSLEILSAKVTGEIVQRFEGRLSNFLERAREFLAMLSTRNLNASSVLFSSQSAPFVEKISSVSLKQVLIATVAAEFVVLGCSVLILARRSRVASIATTH